MAGRKVIFKCRTGSHLYGTNGPDSDDDFLGVFIPSTEDLLGLDKCPPEIDEGLKLSQGDRNVKGDVDSKLYSLKRFFELAMQGQPACLELLFAPKEMVIISTPEWEKVKSMRTLFLNKKGVVPFADFAKSQTIKSEIKGANLNLIRGILALKSSIEGKGLLNMPISFFLKDKKEKEINFAHEGNEITVKYLEVEHKGKLDPMIEVAGLDFNLGLRVKTFFANLGKMESKYGSRSEFAANSQYDYKSLSHAYRLISEGKEFLETGAITLPRPDAEFLKRVKNKAYHSDFRKELLDLMDELRSVSLVKSSLPENPDRQKLNELCVLLHKGQLND